ncbi:MAG: hypothetical protein FJX35_24415 [Alphaproteobacteria bacterium]|nr:hypothetical protein [Alphaproteobacteria bacterium]
MTGGRRKLPRAWMPVALILVAWLEAGGGALAASSDRWQAQGQPPAQPPTRPAPRSEDVLVDSARKLLEALRRFMEDFPVYALPELTENGDIILRRLPPRRDGSGAKDSIQL